MRREPRRLDRGDLARQDLAALRVFVAQIDVDVPGLDRPGGDQHAFQEAMRIGFEKIAVLERAGLALIGIDRHQPRLWLLPHKAPFAPGRETGAAEPAQPGIFERLDDVLDRLLSAEAGLQQLVAARSAIAIERGIARHMRMRLAGRHRRGDTVRCRILVQRVSDRDRRRLVAAAHAGRAHDPHAVAEPAAQLFQQCLAAGQRTGEAVAHPNRDRRRRSLLIHDDVEMGVERGDLVHLCQGEPHLLGKRDEMARIEAAEMVLQEMQMLDQQVGTPFALAQQRLHFIERVGIDLAAFRVIRPAPASRARMNAPIVFR